MAEAKRAGVTRIAATRCLECGHTLDAVGSSDGADVRPEDGAPCACIQCGAVMAFDAAGGLRPFTDREIEELTADAEAMRELARTVRGIHLLRHGVN